MNALSPALLSDLRFALSRFGIDADDVPRDHHGKTITDRLGMLDAAGESYCQGEFRKTDLRSVHASVWDLFPENPATLRAQHDLVDEVGELLREELEFRAAPRICIVRGSGLPVQANVDALECLLSYIDGTSDAPVIDPEDWADTTLFDEAAGIIPGLRAAEIAAITREQLVAELVSGTVPAASAVYVRRALDSDVDGLRNADITLAGYRVNAERLRDATQLALDALLPHFAVAARIRKVRSDLDLIENALHWPGHWQTMPMLREVASASTD